MVDVRDFQPIDLRYMNVQAQQALGARQASEEHLAIVARHPSRTIWRGDQPIFCGGAVELWAGRFAVWAYVAADAGPSFTAVHRVALDFLGSLPARRLETAVSCEFQQGHRWASMLGFRMEAERMRAYSPTGEDHALYARVREH